MSQSVPNTGATAVDASRQAVITQDMLVTPWNSRQMVGSAVATMVWSSAARNIVSNRLMRIVRTSAGVSGTGGAIERASSTACSCGGMAGSSAAISSGRDLDAAAG